MYRVINYKLHDKQTHNELYAELYNIPMRMRRHAYTARHALRLLKSFLYEEKFDAQYDELDAVDENLTKYIDDLTEVIKEKFRNTSSVELPEIMD